MLRSDGLIKEQYLDYTSLVFKSKTYRTYANKRTTFVKLIGNEKNIATKAAKCIESGLWSHAARSRRHGPRNPPGLATLGGRQTHHARRALGTLRNQSKLSPSLR